ncbi:MAG: tetratricopeptide repeat protein [Planctomycetota bacterium]
MTPHPAREAGERPKSTTGTIARRSGLPAAQLRARTEKGSSIAMRSHVKAVVRKGQRALAFAAVLAGCLLTQPLRADLVILKNGREIRGKILLEGDNETTVQVPYGTMTIPRDEIEVIEREADDKYLRKSGERLLAFRDYERALELLRRAHQENPGSEPCRRALVDGLVRTAENARAGRRFRRVNALLEEATKLDPKAKPLVRLKEQLEDIERTRQRLELEAEQAIQTQDFAGAFRHYEQLVEGFPEDREKWRRPYATAAIVLGHVAFEEQLYQNARAFYHTALQHEPGYIDRLQTPLAFAEVQLVVPYLEKGDFKTARARLTQTLDLVPGNAALIYHLALAAEGDGDLSEAANLYASIDGKQGGDKRHLVDLRALAEEQLRRTTGLPAGDPRWRQLAEASGTHESRHFVIAHANGPRAAELERYLEHHLARLQRSWFASGTKPQWRGKVRIVLHSDRDTFHAAANAPSWSQAVTVNERRYGILTTQTVHFNADDPEFLSATLPHELAHVVLPHRLGVGLTIPVWVEEGVATREEPPHKQSYYRRVVAEANAAGELFSVATLLSHNDYPDAARIKVFYAQCNSVIGFLQEKLTRKKFFALLRLLSIYPDPNQALREATPYSSCEQLEGAWRQQLRKVARAR